MLNLPRVTGWGTDTIASTMMKKSADDRDKETERTRMIGNALLQQAQSGNLDKSGLDILSQKFPELAKGAEQENIKVQSANVAKLEKMKLEKIELGGKLFDQKIDAAAKFGDESVYGAGGREFQKAALEEARTYAKMMGKEFNVSAAMDAIDIKKAQKKFKFEVLQENIKGIQSNATPERIAGVERSLGEFASKNKGDPSIPMMEKMIATAKGRLEKEAEITEKKAEEGRKQQAEIAKEDRTQKIKMTNPKTGRTVDIPASQQAQFEKAGWELGGRSEDKPDTVINVDNVVGKQRANDMAYMKSPKFRADIIKDIRSDRDAWDMAGSKKDKDDLIRAEADVRVKNLYPDATFGKGKQGKGWYIKTAKGYELAVPWGE